MFPSVLWSPRDLPSGYKLHLRINHYHKIFHVRKDNIRLYINAVFLNYTKHFL
jgi:hypothetical protein